jgi:hypothetical protein
VNEVMSAGDSFAASSESRHEGMSISMSATLRAVICAISDIPSIFLNEGDIMRWANGVRCCQACPQIRAGA